MTGEQGTTPNPLTKEQVTIFAAGLRYVAAVDGISDHELDVIREFVTDAGYPELMDGLDDLQFDIDQAVAALDSTFMRGVFLKACILLVRSDGAVSESERGALRFLSAAFDRSDDIDQLEQELAEQATEML